MSKPNRFVTIQQIIRILDETLAVLVDWTPDIVFWLSASTPQQSEDREHLAKKNIWRQGAVDYSCLIQNTYDLLNGYID